MTSIRIGRLLLVAVALTACSSNPQPQPAAAAADSAAMAQARADSLARMRADSLARERARADSIARARADSIAAAARAARADSIRAQAERNGGGMGGPMSASGLTEAEDTRLIAPIYFDYDRSDVRADQREAMDAKLTLLRQYPRLELQIEGHADERGSDEYNLALGNRRAASVKRWFVQNGIAESRLTTISYGEERPAVEGSNESAWSQNRRSEFRVTRSAR